MVGIVGLCFKSHLQAKVIIFYFNILHVEPNNMNSTSLWNITLIGTNKYGKIGTTNQNVFVIYQMFMI
jgi:hypothetical protein